VVGLDGSVQELRFERRWHRLRFTQSADRRVFFNLDAPRTQWTILPDGSDRRPVPGVGSHPSYMPNGEEMLAFRNGGIWANRYDDGSERRILDMGSGGHGGPTIDGDFTVADPPKGRFANSILHVRTDGSQTCQRVFHYCNSWYIHTANWHPDHHTTHPHPTGSPDGTKTVFNSDMLGQYSDMYVVVNRLPEPPRQLAARVEGGGVVLTWQEPVKHREIRGYHVYRTDRSGLDYQRLTDEPAPETQWRGDAARGEAYYVVTAVEHSGLESRTSNEAFQEGDGQWRGHARVALEAESGRTVLPAEERIDWRLASNGYCVVCRDEKPGGRLTLETPLPKSGDYWLWARVQGDGALAVHCDAKPCGTIRFRTDEWTWVKADAAIRLAAGAHEIVFEFGAGRERVDKILLSDDTAFMPEGAMALDAEAPDTPRDLRIEPIGPNALKLSWTPSAAADVDHANVYCGAEEGFACDQGSLVGSPSENEFVDGGLALDTAYWYRVAAVDRAGNASAPCAPVRAATPAFTPVHIALRPTDVASTRNLILVESGAAGGPVLYWHADSLWSDPDSRHPASAVWRFKVARDGEYAVWIRSTRDRSQKAAFEFFIDDGAAIGCEVWGMWGEWPWSPVGAVYAGSPERFFLKAGEHVLRAEPRTPISQIADIVVTDDPTWWPVAGMSFEPRYMPQAPRPEAEEQNR
jgi:hypothetical protein